RVQNLLAEQFFPDMLQITPYPPCEITVPPVNGSSGRLQCAAAYVSEKVSYTLIGYYPDTVQIHGHTPNSLPIAYITLQLRGNVKAPILPRIEPMFGHAGHDPKVHHALDNRRGIACAGYAVLYDPELIQPLRNAFFNRFL